MDTASSILLGLAAVYLLFRFFGVLSRWGIRQITPRELDEKKGAVILDVRTKKEFEAGHVPGSIHIALTDIGAKAKKLRKDKEIVVVCQSGSRSIWAIKRMMGMGFTNLVNLKGGYGAWKRLHR